MRADDYRDDDLIADLVRAGLAPDLIHRVQLLVLEMVDVRGRLKTFFQERDKWRKNKRKSRLYRTGYLQNGKNAPSSLLSSSSSPFKREEEEEKKKETEKTPNRPRPVPLPANWEPSPAHFNEGAALGFSHAEILDQAQDMKIWAGANAHRSIARKSSWSLTFSGWMRRTRKTFVGKQRKAAKPAAAEDNLQRPPWEREGKSKDQYFADLKKANGHGH